MQTIDPTELRAEKSRLRLTYKEIAERTKSGYSEGRITKVLTENEPSRPICREVRDVFAAVRAEREREDDEAMDDLEQDLNQRAAGGDRQAQTRLDRIHERRQAA